MRGCPALSFAYPAAIYAVAIVTQRIPTKPGRLERYRKSWQKWQNIPETW